MKTQKLKGARRGTSEQGSALLIALILVTGFFAMTVSFHVMGKGATERAKQRVTSMRLEMAATAAADLVARRVWNGFELAHAANPGTLEEYRAYLESGDSPLPDPLLGPTDPDQPEAFGEPHDVRALFTDNLSGKPQFSRLSLNDVQIRRRDNGTSTDIEVTVTTQTGGDASSTRKTVQQVYSIAGEPFDGFRYALLSNNVNCIMCHARIDNVERYYNSDPSKFGTFDRIRVGTLEALSIRASKAHSSVAGTVYTRGGIQDEHGNPLSTLAGTTLTGFGFDQDGKLREDGSGELYGEDFLPTLGTPLPELGNLYMDYPTDPSDQTDGVLPDSFPPPVPDLNGNRSVDPDEFAPILADSTGLIDGGIIYEVPDSQTYSTGLPSTGNLSELDGSTSANMILIGTEENPIEITGSIAVDGDVAIAGYVRGEGRIYASRNIYVLGDLVYADGTDENGNRTFGIDENGGRNALALAAGGNLVIGNHLQDKRGNLITGDGSGGFGFTMSEMSLFNRGEWSKTQMTLPDQSGVQQPNPLYDADHTPRYYVMEDGNPVYMHTERDVYFDAATATWKGREAITNYSKIGKIDPTDPAYAQASISSMAPKNGWLPNATLIDFWETLADEHSSGALLIDSLLYTNNAAFAIAWKNSDYDGAIHLNGGLVAADTGILAPGKGGTGFQLNYDQRLRNALNIRQRGGPAAFTRSLWIPKVPKRAE